MPDSLVPKNYVRRSQQIENLEKITGRKRGSAQSKGGESKKRAKSNIVHRDIGAATRKTDYKGVEITVINGDYANQKVFLGTDIVTMATSQSANWEEKQGQRMRVGINFVNVSPRTVSFTADLYDSNADISSVVENIAHIQEITARGNNAPPLLSIKMGDTVYQNAVSTNFQVEYSEPLPTVIEGPNKRSGGYRRAKVQLEFKIAGGEGSSYRRAQPFNENTEMLSTFQSLTQAEIEKQAAKAAGNAILSRCLDKAENEEYEKALDDDRLGDPSTYINMSSKLFLQMITADLPAEVVEDQLVRDRIKKELALQFAKDQPASQYTVKQIADSLLAGTDLPGNPTAPEIRNYQALLPAYGNALNAIFDNDFVSISGKKADELLLEASKCGRSLRDSGGLKLLATPSTVDPNFTVSNLSGIIGEDSKDAKLSTSELKELFGMGKSVPNKVVEEIRSHGVFETKADFIAFVSERTDGTTANLAWANLEQNEKATLQEVNDFLENADAKEVEKRFGIKRNNELVEAIAGKTFSSKDEFLQAIYAVENKNSEDVYTVKNGLDKGGAFWLQFKKNAEEEE